MRVTIDTTMGHVSDRIINFVCGVTALVLVGAIVVSALHGGVIMAGSCAACAVLAYALPARSKDTKALTAAALRHGWIRSTRGAPAEPDVDGEPVDAPDDLAAVCVAAGHHDA